jgi:hypothetical protein
MLTTVQLHLVLAPGCSYGRQRSLPSLPVGTVTRRPRNRLERLERVILQCWCLFILTYFDSDISKLVISYTYENHASMLRYLTI